MASEKIMSKVLNGIDDFATKGFKGETMLKSNKAINKAFNFVMGEADTGIRGTLRGINNGDGFVKSAKAAYTTEGVDAAGKAVQNINWKAVGGTYVGAAATGRVLTGGGIYRDSTGRTNLPVVPFV